MTDNAEAERLKNEAAAFNTRGRGFVPETPDQTFAASGPCTLDVCVGLPPSVRLPTTPVLDQGASSTCLAQAICDGVLVKAKIQGVHKARLFARLWVYLHARPDPSIDAGISFSAAVNALTMRGAPAEEHWPFDPDQVTSPAPIEAGQHAWSEVGKFKFHPLDSVESAAASLAQACPVVLGLGTLFGGPHAVLIVGYEYRDGELWFLIKNSWGVSYGEGGYVWISARAIDDDRIGLLGVQWAPSPTEDAK